MALFFFVVGLEIKRELVEGALSDRRRAMLPVVAAVGGMVVPAVLYASVVGSGPGRSGWGIPMATDIAFAIAVLGLTPARHELKVRLLALAIVDDTDAILVIAMFFAADLSASAAVVALLCVPVVLLMQRVGFVHMGFYAPIAAVFWIAVLESGMHATIAGVILGALTPALPLVANGALAQAVRQLGQRLREPNAGSKDESEMLAAEIEELARESESPLDRAERLFHPWSSYIVLPLFALTNSGITLTADALGAAATSPVAWGVALGLLVGKPLAIAAFGWLAVRAGVASWPERVRWRQMAALGVLAGIGFTVSLFITELAVDDAGLITGAKVGIFAASILAAGASWLAMWLVGRTDD